jgi:hypothetical protein
MAYPATISASLARDLRRAAASSVTPVLTARGLPVSLYRLQLTTERREIVTG